MSPAMAHHAQSGHANVTTIFMLLGVVVSGVWIWKRLSPDAQDIIIDQAIPLAAAVLVALVAIWVLIGKLRERRKQKQARARLIALFESQAAAEKRLKLAFAMIEVNEYRREGLEEIAPRLQDVLLTTLTRALGDKQHQVRGMAASHLGVIGDDSVVPYLVAALEDDHAYVRSSAALGLGRLRASAAKEKLASVSKEDWDQ
ncbi:MAG: hypothetical protein GDA68_09830, partial [Nitrospira sp. CR2.1]|nr:hypothetical protein [Nitrospira sp. CR2.1]